jgi:cell division protein FtsB
MQNRTSSAKVDGTVPGSIPRRALNFARRMWRPAASMVAVGLALLLLWHVVNGKNGLSVWQQKRVEDRELRKEIDDLNQENARLREHIERLKSNPDAIGQVAHDKLHYAKPNEVIVTLPQQQQTQPAGAGK